MAQKWVAMPRENRVRASGVFARGGTWQRRGGIFEPEIAVSAGPSRTKLLAYKGRDPQGLLHLQRNVSGERKEAT